jgi:hypothetical protein
MSNNADGLECESTTEINFRLDQNGRTVGEKDQQELDYRTRAFAGHFELVNCCDEGTAMESRNEHAVVNDLLLDCEIADCSIMPRTFWVDHSFRPRCNLEQMAYDILAHHCPTQGRTATVCGAEWWVQIRPFPEKISRYSTSKIEANDSQASCDANNTAPEIEEVENSISFHWDKDEDLRILCNGTVYVHPHLSTVTYLTDNNGDFAPTFIAEDYRVNNLNGEWIVPYLCRDSGESNSELNDSISTHNFPNEKEKFVSLAPSSAFISWPKMGKHLCFDGRFLHAAPSDLAVNVTSIGSFKREISYESDNNSLIKKRRRRRRYTFLVNIWLHHKPYNVHPFPDSMVDKMSGSAPLVPTTVTKQSPKIRFMLEQSTNSNSAPLLPCKNPQQNVSRISTVVVKSDSSVHLLESIPKKRSADCEHDTAAEANSNINPKVEINDRVQQFIWTLGDQSFGEFIKAAIPIEIVHSKAFTGENVRILWHPSSQKQYGMFLIKQPDNDNTNTDHEPHCKRNRVH